MASTYRDVQYFHFQFGCTSTYHIYMYIKGEYMYVCMYVCMCVQYVHFHFQFGCTSTYHTYMYIYKTGITQGTYYIIQHTHTYNKTCTQFQFRLNIHVHSESCALQLMKAFVVETFCTLYVCTAMLQCSTFVLNL